MDYQHGKNKVYLINYHLIWCSKRRKLVLGGRIKERLEEIILEVAKERGFGVLAMEIRPDHLHLFISADPKVSPHQIVRWIKGRSSRILREEFPVLKKLPSLWTRSYFVSTAGNVSSEIIKQYIEAQPKV
jgi:putative transposase